MLRVPRPALWLSAPVLLPSLLIGCGGGEPPDPKRGDAAPAAAEIYREAEEARLAGDAGRALSLLRSLGGEAAPRARAHNLIGVILAGRDSLEAALAQFKTALDLDPDLAVVHNNLGAVYAMSGRPQLAAVAYAEAIRLDPDYPEPHEARAALLLERGQVDAALAALQHARRLRARPDADAHRRRRAASMQSLPGWPWRDVDRLLTTARSMQADADTDTDADADADEGP